MKKITNIVFVLLIIYTIFIPINGNAVIYTDCYYNYALSDDEGVVQGLGLSLIGNLPFNNYLKNNMFYISSSVSFGQKDADKPWSTSRFLIPITVGIYSDYTIPEYPINVGAGIGSGVIYIRKYTPKHYGPYPDFSQTEVHDDVGPRMEVLLGMYYIITQKISFFGKVGYQLSWFDEKYIENNYHGILIHCGVQWTLGGNNRGLFDEY